MKTIVLMCPICGGEGYIENCRCSLCEGGELTSVVPCDLSIQDVIEYKRSLQEVIDKATTLLTQCNERIIREKEQKMSDIKTDVDFLMGLVYEVQSMELRSIRKQIAEGETNAAITHLTKMYNERTDAIQEAQKDMFSIENMTEFNAIASEFAPKLVITCTQPELLALIEECIVSNDAATSMTLDMRAKTALVTIRMLQWAQESEQRNVMRWDAIAEDAIIRLMKSMEGFNARHEATR